MTNATPTIDLAQIAALLQATPRTLRNELRPLDPVLMRWTPDPEQWCINQVIGHLIDTDKRAFAGRIQTLITQDRPAIETWDVAAAARIYIDKDTSGLIDELEALRNEYVRWIVELTPEQLACAGTHPRAGELRVIDFVQEWPYHDRSHIKQILTIVQYHMWNDMGKIRNYLDPPQ